MKGFLVLAVVVLACNGETKEATPKPADPAPAAAVDPEMAKRQAAEAAAAKALAEAKDARARLAQIEHDLDELEGKVNAAVDRVAAAQNAAELDAAKSELQSLQARHVDLMKQVDEARGAQRKAGVKISDECVQNPLAKGCN